VSDPAGGTAAALELGPTGSRARRLGKIAAWIVGIAIFVWILQLLGFDISGWLKDLWHQIRAIPAGYLVAAVILQSAQTVLTGTSYYGIFHAAYPGEAAFRPIVAAYAVGVAGNSFLPANLGTLVTLMMFVAIMPSCTFSGSIAAYLVQKIFFTIAGAFVYVYMFLSVPGTFDLSFGNETHHKALTLFVVLGGVFLLVLVARIFWRQVKKLWAQAKQGGVILSQPRKYMEWVFLPSFLGYLCKLAVVGIFLAAFAIPVTFDSIFWVVGSGSLANVASFTPGAVGVTQATNALALKTCCGVANNTAVAYSTSQQLITSAWNVIFAIGLTVWIFGWTGGKQIVGGAYSQAKDKAAEMKEERKHKHEREAAGEGDAPSEPAG
jgi:uncharacterized membrane protein YbhN (UPF0104 family)